MYPHTGNIFILISSVGVQSHNAFLLCMSVFSSFSLSIYTSVYVSGRPLRGCLSFSVSLSLYMLIRFVANISIDEGGHFYIQKSIHFALRDRTTIMIIFGGAYDL